MKIIVKCAAVILGSDGNPWAPQSSDLSVIDGVSLGDEKCAWYVSDALSDAGIIGGNSFLAISKEGRPRVRTIYWSPNALTSEQQHELLSDTVGQWEDGVGSNGFAVDLGGRTFTVMPRPDETTSISQYEDEHSIVPVPSKAAIAAREGNLDMLRMAIGQGEAVDRFHRGYTPLHWAILYGREPAVSYLLEHGADPNILDKDGNTPLVLCAAARALDDVASERIARLLIHLGARRELQTQTKNTAADIARSRGKVLMLRLL